MFQNGSLFGKFRKLHSMQLKKKQELVPLMQQCCHNEKKTISWLVLIAEKITAFIDDDNPNICLGWNDLIIP